MVLFQCFFFSRHRIVMTCSTAKIYRSRSDAEGFSPDTRVFLPLKIDFHANIVSRRAIKHQPLARKNAQPLPSQLTLNKVIILNGLKEGSVY